MNKSSIWKSGIWKWFLAAGVFVLGIRYFEQIVGFLGVLKDIVFPLILGCVMAYVLNIIMAKIEKLYFPGKAGRWVEKTRRPVCMAISILVVVAIVFLIMKVVFPELLGALTLLGEGIPVYFEKARQWGIEHSDQIPALEEWLNSLELNWPEITKKVVGYLTSGIGGILNSTVVLVGVVGKSVVNFVMGAIFAIYLLFNKEKLLAQVRRIMRVFLKGTSIDRWEHVARVTHGTFTSFIAGQCTEAVILGGLCTLGMLLLRFPYAAMVGTLVGATALIPVMGAYIGAIVGAFMILTVSPGKALGFLVFLVILQQIEGNIIYPRVVGASIGLPGMWVLAAVTVGGGLYGIVGMLVGVPLAATFYKLFSEYINKREGILDGDCTACSMKQKSGS